MSTADFEILAEMDRADALISLVEMQHAAMRETATRVVHGEKWPKIKCQKCGKVVPKPPCQACNGTLCEKCCDAMKGRGVQ